MATKTPKASALSKDSVLTEFDFSLGMRREYPRHAIPKGGVYDSSDFLLHQPGVAIKRGGSSYAGPAFGAGTYAIGVVYADFPSGSKLVGVNNSGAIYTVESGSTTSLSGSTVSGLVDKPKLRIGGSTAYLIFPAGTGSAPIAYDGSNAPAGLGGSPPNGKVCEVYKTRVALANSSSNPQRIYFSPTPSITSNWDTSNSWIDTSYQVTGLASLSSCLLIFSSGHMEKITGTTPPPGTDMTLYTVGSIGCTDARSITVTDNNCIFANPRGVWVTNGVSFVSLTKKGGIESYWQSLLADYDPSTWVISTGLYRSSFLFVSVIDDSGDNIASLMCNLDNRAWWRVTNMNAVMFASATTIQEELYYADRDAARITATSGFFSPSSTNKNDADGTAVTPVIEFRALGEGSGVKSYGFGRLSYYMADAGTDNPSLAVTVKTGLRAAASSTPAESPLGETSDVERKRFTINKDSQALTIRLAQSNASSETNVYALEVEERLYPLSEDGVS